LSRRCAVLEKKNFEDSLAKLMSTLKKRKFDESVELIMTFKNLNIKNTEHRFDLSINLPFPYRQKVKSIVFVKDKNLAQELNGVADKIVLDEDISKISKKEAKKLANEYDVFLAEGPVMLVVGKYLGQTLSPREKMPIVAPPNVNAIKTLIASAIAKQKISNKKNKSSVAVQTKIGKSSQKIPELAENALRVYSAIFEKLPGKLQNIREVLVKTTMSAPVKVGDKQ